jgi:hypothetical protein
LPRDILSYKFNFVKCFFGFFTPASRKKYADGNSPENPPADFKIFKDYSAQDPRCAASSSVR